MTNGNINCISKQPVMTKIANELSTIVSLYNIFPCWFVNSQTKIFSDCGCHVLTEW